MSQNIYDDPQFFEGYSRLKRSVQGLDGAPEWPSMRALLPPLEGLEVADLGCGFGWFCRWARAHGAAGVLGLDLSEKMLARAAALTDDPAIRYLRADLEALTLPERRFGLVYSSLALHYVRPLPELLAQVYHSLVSGGRLVFSTEHPIYTAPSHPGWGLDGAGARAWPVNGYQAEGARVTSWLSEGVVKQHRTVGTSLNLLIQQGFSICHVEEWGPDDGQVAARPELAEERERPMFLLVAARR